MTALVEALNALTLALGVNTCAIQENRAALEALTRL